MTPPTLDQALSTQRYDLPQLDTFAGRSLPFAPSDGDRTAAWKLYVELVTRAATQPIPRQDGDAQTALASIASLFQAVRTIHREHPTAHLSGALAIWMLNVHVRPVTTAWHGRVTGGTFDSDDTRRHFRRDLEALRRSLTAIAKVFAWIATERDQHAMLVDAHGSPTVEPPPRAPSREDDFPDLTPPFHALEREAIDARREAFGIPGTPGRIGLALSGGGLRSATFALGILQALSKRDLYRWFDMLSTVSGGGYIGALISTWATKSIDIDPATGPFVTRPGEVEPRVLRHVRNRSQYLREGTAAAIMPLVVGAGATLWLTVAAAGGLAAAYWGFTLLVPVRATQAAVLGFGISAAILGGGYFLVHGWLTEGALRRIEGVAVRGLGVALALLGLPLIRAVNDLIDGVASLSPALGMPQQDTAVILLPVVTTLLSKALQRTRVLEALGALLLFASPMIAFLLLVARIFARLDGQPPTPELGWMAGIAAVVTGFVLLFTNVNRLSPHRFYRDRLADTFCVANGMTGIAAEPVAVTALGDLAPLHLINATVNLDHVRDDGVARELRGRRAGFFTISKHGWHAPALGVADANRAYVARMDLATAIAVSGAALSPHMGTASRSGLGPWFTLLNLRLGSWLANPRYDGPVPPANGLYLLREYLSWLREDARRVNVSDGGHLENLGAYELLRRRCTHIVIVDAEHDPEMTFHGLMTLIRLARIDFDIEIDIDISDLALNDRGRSDAHAAIGAIRYPKGPVGQLLYIKASITGDEPATVLDYRRIHPTFPHQSTANQLFDEARFEAYRRLGEHIGEMLCSGDLLDRAPRAREDLRDWMASLASTLGRRHR